MKRVSSHYNTLQVLKTAEPKLRKAKISICNKEPVYSISECVLNVLNGNIKLTGCNTHKLQKYKAAKRKVADRHVSLSGKKKLILQRGGFLLHLLSPVLATKQIKSWYVRCTSSHPIVCMGPDSPFSSERNIARALINEHVTRMRSGLRCVERWARQISEKRRRRKRLRIFKMSDAYLLRAG